MYGSRTPFPTQRRAVERNKNEMEGNMRNTVRKDLVAVTAILDLVVLLTPTRPITATQRHGSYYFAILSAIKQI